MRKLIIITALVGITVLALGVGSLAFAQSETPTPFSNSGYGRGMMGGWGGYEGMHSGWTNGDAGPYHDLMVETFAQSLGLSVDQIQSRLESGESIWQIAASEGVSAEEFRDMMQQARETMLDQAVQDGNLTQEQADAMGSGWHMGGFGPGYGDCLGNGVEGGFHRGPHHGWNAP
jgi:hypothetical protein